MKIKTNAIIRIVLYLAVLALIIGTVLFYKSVLFVALGAVVFSYLLIPIVEFMEKWGFKRWLAIIIVYVLIASMLLIGMVLIMPVFITQVQELGAKVSDIVAENENLEQFNVTEMETIQQLMAPLIDFSEKTGLVDLNKLFRDLLIYLQSFLMKLPSSITLLAGKVFNIITFLIMMPTLGFFFINDREKFRKAFFSLVPNRYFELMVMITEKTDKVMRTFFRAMAFEMLIVAVMSSVALTIAGVPYSIVAGMIAGVGNVIPYLGPLIGIVAAVVSILLSGAPLVKIVSAIIALQIVQFIENRFIYPAVMGKSMEMHPMVVLLTVLAGGYTLGVVGMFFSVPAVFLIKEIVVILKENLEKFEII